MPHTEHDEHEHQPSGDKRRDGGDAGDAPDRRPGERREQQAAQRLALEQRVALTGDLVVGRLQLDDGGLVGVFGLGGLERGARLTLRATEIGVGGAVGGCGEVTVDVGGIRLGLGAGVDDGVGIPDKGRVVLFQRGGVGELDVLGRQLVVDVVVGEVAAPGEQCAGGDEHCGHDEASGDEDSVDRPSTERHRRWSLDGRDLVPADRRGRRLIDQGHGFLP